MKASIIIITFVALALVLASGCAGKPEPVARSPEPEAVSVVKGATEYAEGDGLAASAVEVAVPLETRILLRGQNARAEEPSVSVVRDDVAYGKLWSHLAAAGAARPAVDFAKEAVVAAFMGRKSTGGFSVELVGAERLADGTVVVRLRNLAPKPGMMVTQALTSPFVVLAVPAGQDARVSVEFVE